MPIPVNPNVTITPPVGTTLGSCTSPVSPVGANATIHFSFAPGNPGWTITAFAMKATSPVPPAGMFTNTTPYGNPTLVIQDANGDGVLYSYNLTIAKGGVNHTIDPDIQNDSAQR
jgi:hypothetical protein